MTDKTCDSVCWISKYGREAYCDLPVDHDGNHSDMQEGWEW